MGVFEDSNSQKLPLDKSKTHDEASYPVIRAVDEINVHSTFRDKRGACPKRDFYHRHGRLLHKRFIYQAGKASE